jgi:hypothetical protein
MDNDDYTIDFDLVGFTFDANGDHFTVNPHSVGTAIAKSNRSDNPGYVLPGRSLSGWQNTPNQPMFSIDIGCGRYRCTVTGSNGSMSFILDLTDRNLTNTSQYYPIAFTITSSGSDVNVYGQFTDDVAASGNTLGLVGYVWMDPTPGTVMKYWGLVSAYHAYSRDRHGFTMRANHYPLDPATDATLDVNVRVTGDVDVSSPKTFRVDTDFEPSNSFWETTLEFDDGVYFNVHSGASLIVQPTLGYTYWRSPFGGSYWGGINVDNTNRPVILEVSQIAHARYGIHLNECRYHNVSVAFCYIDSSQYSGMYNLNGDPEIFSSDFVYSGTHGIENIGPYSKTLLRQTRSENNGMSGNGSGIYCVNGSYLHAEVPGLEDNVNHGLWIDGAPGISGAKAWIRGGHIFNNGECGILVNSGNSNTVGWVEQQNTAVTGNEIGLKITGGSILRGWHREQVNEYDDADSMGLNCVSYNTSVNLHGEDASQFLFGEIYPDGNGVPHYRGGYNDITNPGNHQGDLVNGAYGGLVMNWWGSDWSVNGPNYFKDPEALNSNDSCIVEGPPPSHSREGLPVSIAATERLLNTTFDVSQPLVPQIREAFLARRTERPLAVKREPQSDGYALSPPYPNPFPATTQLSFTLPAAEHVSLRVYDILGREAGVLVEGYYPPGRHPAVFEAGMLPIGLYIAVLRTARRTLFTRILLDK